MATVLVRDETIGGHTPREWSLELPAEQTTVRELIRSRVYQEVQDFNLGQKTEFLGLVQPEGLHPSPAGKRRAPREIDWKSQFDLALRAFRENQLLLLVDDRQVESLDQLIEIGSSTRVTFLRLVLLVGG